MLVYFLNASAQFSNAFHQLFPLCSFTSGIPVTGNLTILLTIEPTVKSFGRVLDTYPAIEHHIKLVSHFGLD